jgi:pantoate--beta-alanine ligase
MKSVIELQDLRNTRSQMSEPVGLVPTMGFLHAGHISLVKRARKECASVVVSIFVNPTQFDPGEDLGSYPRDITRDLELLRAEGVDLLWMPTPEVMYPADYQTWVDVQGFTKFLEGASRPTHFRGVSTVVAKLFNAVNPQKAYFGQKDAQQAMVIRQMTRDLNFPIEIVICPIFRETDGLAMSSRNSYLTPTQRQAATVLWRSLNAAKLAFESGERDAEQLRTLISDVILSEPLAQLGYVSVANVNTLAELKHVKDDALFSVAVYVGRTRLIDNFLFKGGCWVTGNQHP